MPASDNLHIVKRLTDNLLELASDLPGNQLPPIVADLISYQGNIGNKDLTVALYTDLLKMRLPYFEYVQLALNNNKIIAYYISTGSPPPGCFVALAKALDRIAGNFPLFALHGLNQINFNSQLACGNFVNKLIPDFLNYQKYLAQKLNITEITPEILAKAMYDQLAARGKLVFFSHQYKTKLEQLLNVIKENAAKWPFAPEQMNFLIATLEHFITTCEQQLKIQKLHGCCNNFQAALAHNIQLRAKKMLGDKAYLYYKPDATQIDLTKIIEHSTVDLLFQHDKGRQQQSDGSYTYSPSVQILRNDCRQYRHLMELQGILNAKDLSPTNKIANFAKAFNGNKSSLKPDSLTHHHFGQQVDRILNPTTKIISSPRTLSFFERAVNWIKSLLPSFSSNSSSSVTTFSAFRPVVRIAANTRQPIAGLPTVHRSPLASLTAPAISSGICVSPNDRVIACPARAGSLRAA